MSCDVRNVKKNIRQGWNVYQLLTWTDSGTVLSMSFLGLNLLVHTRVARCLYWYGKPAQDWSSTNSQPWACIDALYSHDLSLSNSQISAHLGISSYRPLWCWRPPDWLSAPRWRGWWGRLCPCCSQAPTCSWTTISFLLLNMVGLLGPLTLMKQIEWFWKPRYYFSSYTLHSHGNPPSMEGYKGTYQWTLVHLVV